MTFWKFFFLYFKKKNHFFLTSSCVLTELKVQPGNTTVVVSVKLTRIMLRIFHCIRALYSTHTSNTYRCHKATALAMEVASNLLCWETYDCISNEPNLTASCSATASGCGLNSKYSEATLLLCWLLIHHRRTPLASPLTNAGEWCVSGGVFFYLF